MYAFHALEANVSAAYEPFVSLDGYPTHNIIYIEERVGQSFQ